MEELETKGFDPANLIKRLTEQAHADRENAAEQKLRTDNYTAATGAVSTVEGVLGKTHALTEKLRGLRVSLIGNQGTNGGTTPPA